MTIRIEASQLEVHDGAARVAFPPEADEPVSPHPTDCIHGRIAVHVGERPLDLRIGRHDGEQCLRQWIPKLRLAHDQLEAASTEYESAYSRSRGEGEWIVFPPRGTRALVRDGATGEQVACDRIELQRAIAAFLDSLHELITNGHPDGGAWWRDVSAKRSVDP